MTQFKKGDAVKQIMPAPITGIVDRFAFDATTGDVDVVVQRTDAEGHVHETVFGANEIELAGE